MAASDLSKEFRSITSSSAATAKFYLDLAQGDVAAAVDQFYASGGTEVPQQPEPQSDAPSGLAGTREPIAGPSQSRSAAKPPARRRNEKVTGFGDLQGGLEDSDDDENNEYYTGGEKSGMVVKGGDGANGAKDVDTYFDMLETAGARRGRPEDLEQRESRNAAFTGRGRRLGDNDEDTATAMTSDATEPQPSGPQTHTITFWRNNVFTVNDGEPRSMTDPANRPFLEAIGRGEAPRELMSGDRGTEIQVNCIRSNSDYEAPAKKIAFTGKGQTLAGARPTKSPQQPAASGSRTWEGVDSAKPVTSLQLRLTDGSRMVARFNHSQTVADIRRFIHASRPDLGTAYSLVTAFPSAELKDDSASLADAGLLNAVVIQKA